MISILTTNLFSGQDHVIMAAKCLSTQTCQDFEWVFLDGHYNKNKDLVSSLCAEFQIRRYIHAPLCKANHVGRMFHWEVYNNALLLASHDLFLRFGMYRWIHPSIIGKAVGYAEKGIFIDIPHTTVKFEDFNDLNKKSIIEKSGLIPSYSQVKNYMECSAGMFSYSRNRMLEINGNNEAALLIVHHEDADLNARWKHVQGVMSIKINNAMLRFDHQKICSHMLPLLEEGNSYCCGQPGCFSTYPNTFHLNYDPPVENEKFMYRDFQWIKCSCCGTISPVDADEYLDYLRGYSDPFGPVGVDGRVGRSLIPLYEDCLNNDNLYDKINILRESHTNPKYIESETRIDSVQFQDEHLNFKNRIESYCKSNNIKFIDRELLFKQHTIDKDENNETLFDIKKYIKPHMVDCEEDIFIFELLQDEEHIYHLNEIFNMGKSERVFMLMKHNQYSDVIKDYRTIEWWDEYISNNKNIYSDAEEAQKIRDNMYISLKNYMNCFYCIKKYPDTTEGTWHF